MKALLLFEWRTYFKRPGFYVLLLLILLSGVFVGSSFNLSISPEIYKNSSYTIAYVLGLMSLLCIFFSTILTTQILFKETEANFNLILYATPIRKQDYLLSRFIAVTSISFFCFTLFTSGFAIGQMMPDPKNVYTDFNVSFYLQPLLLFGLVNTVFCSAVLCSIAWVTKNKLMVYVSGLFIYIIYMVMLLFSGSPLMAKGMPQSPELVQLSAMLDPFGLSAYFLQTTNWSVIQHNTELVSLTGILLFNRLGIIFLSILVLIVSFKTFTFSVNEKRNKKLRVKHLEEKISYSETTLHTIQPSESWLRHWVSLFSFTKLDLKYITKDIPFVLACISLLFAVSMEMYGSIEKGIRIPQQYASSGLMAKTIIDTLHGLCLIIILYYANEIVWRSRNSNFHLIEQATPTSSTSLFISKWLTLSIVIVFFTTLMILLGIVFQMRYDYPRVDWDAYAGVYLFTGFPLIISAGVILIIHQLIRYKYIGLIVSSVIVFLTATSMGNKLFSNPLLKFQLAFRGLYSDMNGFDSYLSAFTWRYAFGLCVVAILALLLTQLKRFSMKLVPLLSLIILIVIAYISGQKVVKDYQPKSEETILLAQAEYEKSYRSFQNKPQPTITNVEAKVDLVPEKNAYDVITTYRIQNKTNQPISRILVNFANDINIGEVTLINGNEVYRIKNQYHIITLKKPLQPSDTATFRAKFSYHWAAVNGHQSFNAIVQNGSFMRISRYFPTFGYMAGNEITNEGDRKRFNLGKATQLPSIDSPKDSTDDFINLDMTISTNSQQTAVGVGELVRKWSEGNRNYFQYKTPSPIPFRFAVSSARYAVKALSYKGKDIEIYYHPAHAENVKHLLRNAQLTMDYCETNFGTYPFKTIRFAEISGFTKGFAATAYPATIYMTENMIFNANINADKKQDVINELAGHELAHLWWGNSQIAPDIREGDVLLTEALAMYTELMLVKRMHGRRRVLENVNMHLGMYLDERGYTEEQPLFKMLSDNTHLSYSKSLVVMYQLTEMIGEEKVNLALRKLLQKYAYPNPRPISTDFINELYAVTDTQLHTKINDWFKKITLYDFMIQNASVKKINAHYELTINAIADKYYEDGNGKKSKVPLKDSVEIALYFKNGKEKIVNLLIINNTIAASILLDELPESLLIDPNLKFIKPSSEKYLIK